MSLVGGDVVGSAERVGDPGVLGLVLVGVPLKLLAPLAAAFGTFTYIYTQTYR